jgi:hypothetical protein
VAVLEVVHHVDSILGFLQDVLMSRKLKSHSDEVTRRLNEVYDRKPSELDPVLLKIAARAHR